MWEESVGGWAEEEEGKEVVMCSHRLNRFSTCGDESVFLDFWTFGLLMVSILTQISH